jgi:hypothetical protein
MLILLSGALPGMRSRWYLGRIIDKLGTKKDTMAITIWSLVATNTPLPFRLVITLLIFWMVRHRRFSVSVADSMWPRIARFGKLGNFPAAIKVT